MVIMMVMAVPPCLLFTEVMIIEEMISDNEMTCEDNTNLSVVLVHAAPNL